MDDVRGQTGAPFAWRLWPSWVGFAASGWACRWCPVWLIAPTLALYGTGSFVYAFFTEYGVLGLGGAASVAFGGYGWALGIAAGSYQTRTRPTCARPVHYRLLSRRRRHDRLPRRRHDRLR